MPPKRRSTGAAATTRNQPTLSFNNKTRVTKQSNILPPSLDKKPAKRLSDQAQAEIINQVSEVDTTSKPDEPEVADINIEDNEVADQQTPVAKEEEPTPASRPRRKSKRSSTSTYDTKIQEAQKLSDTKIKAYWKAEEDSRLAPRVHQKDVHLHEKILRHFDLSSQYGPCIGITRLERWKRAANLGMDPPVEVLAVLLKEEKKGNDKGIGGRQCGQLAYIDELAGGRAVLVE